MVSGSCSYVDDNQPSDHAVGRLLNMMGRTQFARLLSFASGFLSRFAFVDFDDF